jgi:hypothetical protein
MVFGTKIGLFEEIQLETNFRKKTTFWKNLFVAKRIILEFCVKIGLFGDFLFGEKSNLLKMIFSRATLNHF